MRNVLFSIASVLLVTTSAFADIGANLKYASCGVSKERSVDEWKEEQREFCTVVPEVHCEWRTVRVLQPGGFRSVSEGLMLIGFEGQTSALEERITTESVTQVSSYIESLRVVHAAIEKACTAWKIDARSRLGDRMLAASCMDTRRPPQLVDEGNGWGKFELTGLILIKR